MQVNYEDLSEGCKHLDTKKRLWGVVRCVDCNELILAYHIYQCVGRRES